MEVNTRCLSIRDQGVKRPQARMALEQLDSGEPSESRRFEVSPPLDRAEPTAGAPTQEPLFPVRSRANQGRRVRNETEPQEWAESRVSISFAGLCAPGAPPIRTTSKEQRGKGRRGGPAKAGLLQSPATSGPRCIPFKWSSAQ